MAYMNRFINDDGFEEWTTTDAAGNLLTCYANKFVELHTKIPVCECGRPMTEEVQGTGLAESATSQRQKMKSIIRLSWMSMSRRTLN